MTDASATPAPAAPPNRQFVLVAGIAAGLIALLAAGYLFFVRVDYVVLFAGLREADAAAIKAELDKKGVDLRLRDGGATILVPADQADAARLEVAGSEASARGLVGFELFNKSDMGLTNFAQKINYQRALQGELVRTITAMDGVDSARVHLALPERSLFRGERHDPSAAVTIAMKAGRLIDVARGAGVQRLVAAAVPDLPEAKVVVLDAAGRVVSPAAAPDADLPADVEERGGVEQYYRARARQVVARVRPGLDVAVRVLVLPNEGNVTPSTGARNYGLRLLLVTPNALTDDGRAVIRDAVTTALELDPARGDEVVFETGPVPGPVARPAQSVVGFDPATTSSTDTLGESDGDPAWASPWIWGVVVVLVCGALIARRRARARATMLLEADHIAFADQLRRQLRISEAGDAAA